MAEEQQVQEQSHVETTVTPVPDDFREFEKWRQNGGAPESGGDQPAATPVEKPETEQTSEAAKQEADTETREKKARGGFQKRINELTREKYTLQEELSRLRAQVSGPKDEEGGKPATAGDGGPVLEDFETYEKFIDARTEWKISQAEKAREAERRARNEKATQEELENNWQSSVDEFREKTTDYDEVLAGAKDIAFGPVMAQAIKTAERGPEVAYYLAKHPDEARKIAGLDPLPCVLAIGKIQAALESTETKVPEMKTRSSAPPPAKAVRSSAKMDPTTSDFGGDFSAWEKARYEQLRKR